MHFASPILDSNRLCSDFVLCLSCPGLNCLRHLGSDASLQLMDAKAWQSADCRSERITSEILLALGDLQFTFISCRGVTFPAERAAAGAVGVCGGRAVWLAAETLRLDRLR